MLVGHFCPPGSGSGSRYPTESGSTQHWKARVSTAKKLSCLAQQQRLAKTATQLFLCPPPPCTQPLLLHRPKRALGHYIYCPSPGLNRSSQQCHRQEVDKTMNKVLTSHQGIKLGLLSWEAYIPGRWAAKLVAHLLATTALWVRIQTSPKNTKWTTKAKEWPTHSRLPKNTQKNILPLHILETYKEVCRCRENTSWGKSLNQ